MGAAGSLLRIAEASELLHSPPRGTRAWQRLVGAPRAQPGKRWGRGGDGEGEVRRPAATQRGLRLSAYTMA